MTNDELKASPGAVLEEQIDALDDLVTMVRRLARALHKAAPAEPLTGLALDYLERKGFNKGPLRSAVNCEWTNCVHRVGDICCNDRVASQSLRIEVTEEMVAAYLTANDAYWKRADELPARNPAKWRQGTPSEATRESLRAALDAASPADAFVMSTQPHPDGPITLGQLRREAKHGTL